MNKFIIAGNWKMHLNRKEVVNLLTELKILDKKIDSTYIDVVICPASVYLEIYSLETKFSKIKLGAQNVASNSNKSFTGEISAMMLREFDCNYVIIGHSERRKSLQENYEHISNKFVLAKSVGITPILCVGNEEEEYEDGFITVYKQLKTVIDKVGIKAFNKDVVIAYEPVSAIGTGNAALPEKIQDMHAYIRKLIGNEVRIIYGGSINSDNAEKIFKQPDVDGGLIGRASLKAKDFIKICHKAMSIVGS